MKTIFCFFIAQVLLFSFPATAQKKDYPFNNSKLLLDTRIKDMLSRLTVEEKISLLNETFEGIPRLNIPKYFMGNEALHGVLRPGKFTVFPQSIGLAATWNPDLMYKVATAISDEARGRWNELKQGALQKNQFSDLLVFWSPDINLARDPRWGRTQETYGEDPLLSSKLAVAFVKGLQGNDPKYLKVVATPKHFTANNEEHNRFECNAIMSEKSLREYYLVPFEYAVKEGKAESLMAAYNAINGIPCSASKKLLTDILRHEWGFKGYVVSDCGGPGFAVYNHKYVQTPDSAAVVCLNAGLDIECSGYCGYNCFVFKNFLKPALDKGWIKEWQIDSAAYRVLRARFKMGVYDKDFSENPYNKISPSVVGSKKNKQLALKAARQSIVLLKNDNANNEKEPLLPLNKNKIKSIAVLGPNSANCEFGGYSAKESANEPVSVLKGIINKLGGQVKVNYVEWTHEEFNDYEIIPQNYFNNEKSEKHGLYAEYFNNRTLNGTPKTRVDKSIDFNPTQQAPDPTVPAGEKSIRWTGYLVPAVSGVFTVAANSKDGIKVWIDDRLMIDKWINRPNSIDTFSINLEANKKYKLKVEYCHLGGDPVAQLRWKTPGESNSGKYKMDIDAAASSDYVVVVLGLNTSIENEGKDKKDLNLPQRQEEFIKEIAKVNPHTIVILEGGSPLSVNWINKNIPAVLNAWYAGEQGGNAIAGVLFGDYNPAGRLPLTYYKSTDDLLPFDDYEIMKGRTYMYLHTTPLYPFGYGLTYSKFNYSNLRKDKSSVRKKGTITINVDIKNAGNYDGDEVVQLYVKNISSNQPQPLKVLKGFKRVHLKKGETKTVSIPLKAEELRYFDQQKNSFEVEQGEYEIQIGASSEDIRLRGKITVE